MKRCLKGMLVALMVIGSTINVHGAATISQRVQGMIDKMTPEEKVAQMIQADTRWITPEQVAQYKIGSILSGGGAAPSSGNELANWAASADSYQKAVIENGGVPLLYGIDAVHGNNNLYGATIYPHNIGLSAANDASLITEIGKATTSEVKAMGANWTFTPTLGVPHNERWGRTYETFGDDVNRVTELGNAYISGLESSGEVLATAKHYLGEGLTTNGTNQGNVVLSDSDYQALVNADMSNAVVKEILTPYKKAIAQGVDSIMVSYNSINGKKCHGNKDVVTTLLKEKLGFKGIVISDYNGLDQIESAASYADKAVACVNAGVDMLMVAESADGTPRWQTLYNSLVAAVNAGKIETARLDDACARILTAKENLGLFDDASKAYASTADQAKFGGEEHRALARKAVSESLVLLKNDEISAGKTAMQALADMKNIVIAGSGADNIGKQCGGWTITWQGATGNTTKGTTVFSGLKAAMEKNGGKVSYSPNGFYENNEAQAAVVVAGENPYAESNGDRAAGQLKLPAADVNTINTIKADHPDTPIILVLETGRPIAISDYVNDSQIKGIVNAWLPGSEGAGVADVLLGNKDFTGTNPITWTWYPQDIENKTDASKVLYPVGYGLKKAEKTGEATAPTNPSIVDLTKTKGKLEAEAYVDAESNIKLETSATGTHVGYLAANRYMTYKINVGEKASYKLTLRAARETASTINGAFELYLDDVKVLKSADTSITTTGGWTTFTDQVMNGSVSLKSGEHTLKFVATAKDFNIDYFTFEKNGEYVEPEVQGPVTSEGTGAMVKDDAVTVSMSSSENSQSMSWYAGNQKISNKNATKDPLDVRIADDSTMTTINVDPNKQYQELLGLGTSVEDSTINNLMKMTDENRRAFIKRLVDPVNGTGMTLFRLTIGTADFTATEFYTYYDKLTTDEPDWENKTGKGFSIEKDEKYGIIKVIKEIQEIAKECGVEKDLKFFASPWTPPGWMKKETTASKSYANNELLLKGGALSDDHIDDAAKYYVRFIEEYAKLGIPIYSMTLQNEPMLEIDYPSCAISGKQEAKLAKAIKKEVKASKVLDAEAKKLKIWAFDHNFNGADSFMADFFKEAGDDLNIEGIAFHPYGGVASTMGSFYEKYKDQLTVNLTERSVWGAPGANDIITWLRNGSESYNSWVTMLDSKIQTHHWTGTPDPTMFVQDATDPNNYWATPEVYITSQFSKYIRPGFVRVSSNLGSSSTITNVVFKNPETNELVMVAANQTGTDQAFKVVVGNTQFNAVLPAGNVATYTWTATDTEIKAHDVPGTFKASEVASSDGLKVNEDGTLGNLTAGATADYYVNAPETGIYDLSLNVASANTDSKTFTLKNDAKEIGTTVYNSTTGNWGAYETIRMQVQLEKGVQRLSLVSKEGSVNIKDLTFKKGKAVSDVPGYVNATNYQSGKGLVVEDGIVKINTISWAQMGEVIYNLNVQKEGDYKLNLDYSTDGDTDGNYWVDVYNGEIKVGDPVSAGHPLKATGAKDKFSTNNDVTVHLVKGDNKVGIVTNLGTPFNLKSVSLGANIRVSAKDLQEGKLDGKTITVNLASAKFAKDLNKANWTIEGLPEGISFDVKRDSDTKATITLKGNELVDYDTDLAPVVKVDATEVGDSQFTLSDDFVIKANDDKESLNAIKDVKLSDTTFKLEISGGKFAKDLKASDVVLSDNMGRYVAVKSVALNDDRTVATVTLDRKVTNYADIVGTVTLNVAGYNSGNVALEQNITLEKSSELPTAIELVDGKTTLSEDKAYASVGTLGAGSAKGNYVDYFIDIKKAGKYILTYKVNNNEAVENALKISGGEGLKTDNMESVSFSKFWNNALGYVQALDLKAGQQTLRLEVNTAGFTLTDLAISEMKAPIEIGKDATTITADKMFDGSNDKGWGIEVKSDLSNVGCSVAGSYQDYLVDVKESGEYSLVLNYAHNDGGDAKAIFELDNGTALGEIILKSTGAWDTFKDSDATKIKLAAGQQVIRIKVDNDGFNYRNMQLHLENSEPVDNVKPVITGTDNVTIYTGNADTIKDLLDLVVTDDVDGDLLDKVEITSNLDKNVAGTYTVTVTATDKAGNVATKEFTITVVTPAQMIGVDEVTTINVGDKFDPMTGFKVVDVDGTTDITDKLELVSNDVNTAKAGEYKVVYRVVDALGNNTTFTRTIIVKEKAIDTPDTPDVPDVPNKPANPVEKPNGNQQVIVGKVEATKTGDETSINGVLCLLGLSAIGCLLLKKRKFD